MAYIGTAPAEAYSPTAVKDSFNGDGSTVAFTMSQPSKTNDVRVVVENVIQDPTVAYTCTGTTIEFTSAPPVGTANVYVVHLGLPVQSIVPPDEINIATTYTSDLTVQGAFTSQGIDDNATSTTMTLDSSGHTMFATTDNVVQTNSGTGNGGVVIRGGSNPYLAVASDGSAAGEFNRLASDGPVVQFRKDGTTVGSIGSAGSGTEMYIGSSGTNKNGIYFTNSNWLAPMQNLAVSDNTQNIGHPSYRWKDLYLSGGVYLGGTGSANYLDEYEEGTWTPTLVGAVSYGQQWGSYVKVGNVVHFTVFVVISSGATGNQLRVTLPFASLSGTDRYHAYRGWQNSWSSSGNSVQWLHGAGNAYIVAYNLVSSGGVSAVTETNMGTGNFIVTGSYRIA